MTVALESRDLCSCFEIVQDSRIDRTKDHLLIDILFVSVAATIAGADGPTDIELFTKQKLDWIASFVHECDSQDRSSVVRFVPIDGKTLRGSKGAKHRCDGMPKRDRQTNCQRRRRLFTGDEGIRKIVARTLVD